MQVYMDVCWTVCLPRSHSILYTLTTKSIDKHALDVINREGYTYIEREG